MKFTGRNIAVLLALVGFFLSANVMGDPPENLPEETSLPESMSMEMPMDMPMSEPEAGVVPESIPETGLQEDFPEKRMAGSITYVSGGVGQGEALKMKKMASQYPLEVVFVQKTHQREAYLAEVKVQIKNATGETVLDITTDGPILLADLPAGAYLITAEYNNIIKSNRVRISAKKHQRTVFLWPMQ